MKIKVFSFGFMHGCAEAEYVFDLRFLPNPYWDPALRARSGDDPKVAAFVLDHAETKEFLALLKPLLTVVCAGRVLMEDGVIPGEEEIVSAARAAAARLTHTA